MITGNRSNNIVFYGLLITGLFALISCAIFSATGTDTSSEGESINTDPTSLTANVTEVVGDAQVRPTSDAEFLPATPGTQVQIGGQVKTLEDGHMRLDLSTGTIIRVAPNSVFTLTSNETEDGTLLTKLNLELGRVFIILNGGALSVETGAGVASVRGSYMMTEKDTYTNNMIIGCLEGQCNAEDGESDFDFSNGHKVILYAYNQNGERHKADLTVMTSNDFFRWLDEVPEANDMVEFVAKDLGIGISPSGGDNCDKSKGRKCNGHPGGGNGKGNDK